MKRLINFTSLFLAFLPEVVFAQTDINLIYTSFLGGNSFDFATFAQYDESTNLFVTGGLTQSIDLPTSPNAFQSFNAGLNDGYFAKIDAEGNIVYASYLGGSNGDDIGMISFTPAGDYIICGETRSPEFPLEDEDNGEFEGIQMGFLTKFDENNELIWSTFVGGESNADRVDATQLDSDGNIYIIGSTFGNDLSTPGVYQEEFWSTEFLSGFVGKYNSDGEKIWISYLAQEDFVAAADVALSPDGDALYVFGLTMESASFSNGTHQNQVAGSTDAVLLSFDSETGTLNWGTYFGGDQAETVSTMKVTSSGNIIISGTTTSTSGIATSGAFQENLSGSTDPYIASFSPEGQLNWSTYLGGEETSPFAGVWLNIKGSDLYISILTQDENMPMIGNPYFDDVELEEGDFPTTGYLAKFDLSGNPQWSTYTNENYICGNCFLIAVNNSGNIFCAGAYLEEAASDECEGSVSSNAFQDEYGGGLRDFSIFIYEDNTLSSLTQKIEPLEIFPNPADTYVQINAPNFLFMEMELTVTDVSGRTVDKVNHFQSGSQYDTGKLSNGVYIVSGRSGNRVYREKLVIQ